MFGKLLSVWLIMVSAVSWAESEPIDFKPCPGIGEACLIHELRVDPCPQAVNHAVCQVRRRKPASASWDFTTAFDAASMEVGVSWVKSADQELPLVTLDRDACKYMSCPVRAGERNTYSITLPIESKFPLNTYRVKWLMTAPTGQQCCTLMDIKLVR